jgi:hypothetical protein
MRVRITRRPPGVVQDVSLQHYRPGEVYDLPPALAEYLVMHDLAIVEMRDPVRTQTQQVRVERRRRA